MQLPDDGWEGQAAADAYVELEAHLVSIFEHLRETHVRIQSHIVLQGSLSSTLQRMLSTCLSSHVNETCRRSLRL